MRIFKNLLFIFVVIAIVIISCKKDDDEKTEDPPPPALYEVVKIETEFGDLMMWLYNETPLHKENFINLTEQGFYDSLIFHRVVNDFVIQGGDP
ncbi:MAG: peptidylprolyl isomerase, partial [Bacteroidetes bacterium]|nr:peptidylprolyl isomerase [Bacteroidota bacterium]